MHGSEVELTAQVSDRISRMLSRSYQLSLPKANLIIFAMEVQRASSCHQDLALLTISFFLKIPHKVEAMMKKQQ
jgi:hypothetical protein